MPYLNQDLQQEIKKFLKTDQIPPHFMSALKKHDPHLHYLLKPAVKHKKVFDKDIESFVAFVQGTGPGAKYSPNPYQPTKPIEQRIHETLRQMNIDRKENPFFERKQKKLEIYRRFNEARLKEMSPEERATFETRELARQRIIEMAQRKINIRTARKKSDRLAEAQKYVEKTVSERREKIKRTQHERTAPLDHGSDITDLVV